VEDIIKALPEKVYLSIDIDGLDPGLCPNTGTPVPGGLSFEQTIYLLEQIANSQRTIIGFDLSEVAPGNDEWDANVGARLLYRLANLTLKAKGL
jgi:agmatinase